MLKWLALIIVLSAHSGAIYTLAQAQIDMLDTDKVILEYLIDARQHNLDSQEPSPDYPPAIQKGPYCTELLEDLEGRPVAFMPRRCVAT